MTSALLRFAASAGLATICLHAQPPQQQLQYMLVLSRHGLRTPLWIPEQADQYAAQPWPKWDVPLGNLTARGKIQMEIMGAYDREYLLETGLLMNHDCADAPSFYFYADSFERDIDSAHALAGAMLPNCDVPVHGLPLGQLDPLFKPLEAGIGHYDAALAGRERPKEPLNAFRPSVESVEEILLGESSSAKRLPADPAEAFSLALKAVDSFLMEYQGALDNTSVGWGHLDAAKIGELRKFKAEADDLGLTSYAARATASNLLDHILLSLRQAESGKMIPGAIGRPGDKALYVLGHDSDMQRIARMLDLAWVLNGNAPHETPPGCALVFELWRDASGRHTVRVYFQTPTVEQIRSLTPLSLKNPPERIPLSVRECMPCDWTRFQQAVESAIDPAFVAP